MNSKIITQRIQTSTYKTKDLVAALEGKGFRVRRSSSTIFAHRAVAAGRDVLGYTQYAQQFVSLTINDADGNWEGEAYISSDGGEISGQAIDAAFSLIDAIIEKEGDTTLLPQLDQEDEG